MPRVTIPHHSVVQMSADLYSMLTGVVADQAEKDDTVLLIHAFKGRDLKLGVLRGAMPKASAVPPVVFKSKMLECENCGKRCRRVVNRQRFCCKPCSNQYRYKEMVLKRISKDAREGRNDG